MTATTFAADDARFTPGFRAEVWTVLERHGYQLPADTPARHLALGKALDALHELTQIFEGAR